MAADYGRIHRLLKILMLIQGESGWTAKRLALECGTTERNVYRDLQMLEGAGIPYSFDKETGGYKVGRDFFMPPVSLTLEESLALVALAEHVGGKEQIPFMEPAAKAISKVRCSLPQKVQDELAKLDDRLAIQLAAASPPEGTADMYQTMRAALANRCSLLCQYESVSAKGDKDTTDFIFKPYTLFFSTRAWYAVGYHAKRRDVRCLKLNRFIKCQPTSQKYEVPKTFSLKKHLGSAWRMIRGAKTYAVELHFDPEFADTIADTHWHDTQQILWQDDKSIIFKCKVDGLDEIVWWLLSMGPHCLVKKPKELATRIRQLAAEMVALYPAE